MKKLILILSVILVSIAGCKKIDPYLVTKEITANDFLSDSEYKKLIIEVVYINGHRPTPEALTALQNNLVKRLNKSGGTLIVEKEINSPGFSNYSVEDIRELEKTHREYFPKKEVISAFIFFADAGYAGDQNQSKALGIAYDPTSIAIFEKTIMDHSGGIGQTPRWILEATALLHEFGHLLGLVNSGTNMTEHHQDVANGHHCTNQNCIMYYATETTDVTALLTGGTIPDFDDKCIQDLKNNGGK